jgi:chromosome segregation ATPase
MAAEKVEELHVQYWRLSKLDDLEELYYEAGYSLPLILRLHDILKDNKITKDKDIKELIELANHSLPEIRNRFEELLNQVGTLENEKATLNTEILGLRNSIHTNNEIIRKKKMQLQILDRKLRQLKVMLQAANKDPNYNKVIEIVDQSLNDKRLLLVTALVAILNTLEANPFGLNLLNSSSLDIEDYIDNDIDGKYLLQFAESCYNTLLKGYVKAIV